MIYDLLLRSLTLLMFHMPALPLAYLSLSCTSLTKGRSLILPPFLTSKAKNHIQMQKSSKNVTGAIITPISCTVFCHPVAALPPLQQHFSGIRSALQYKGSATFATTSQKTETGSSFQCRSAFSKEPQRAIHKYI